MLHPKRSRSKFEGGCIVELGVDDYPPPKYKSRLGCPFAKFNRKRYERVNTPCTSRWGFSSITTLNEHIKRYHSSKDACIRCKEGIEEQDTTGDIVKCDHSEEPEKMTVDQERKHKDWAIGRSMSATDAEKWTWIFEALFPNATGKPLPWYDYLRPSHRDDMSVNQTENPKVSSTDNMSSLAGLDLLLFDTTSPTDTRIAKRLRADDSQSISRRITDFSISTGPATSDSGISLSFDPDKLHGDRITPPPSDCVDPALLGSSTLFSLREQLEWQIGSGVASNPTRN
ncbi:hypothetical protein GLAREA_01236 [Glarea lozoyensis ATCC 20868]|uniref:C2H2-type domain-containing protein n=1 Tax=Glarea lozoyensis (strain ATCC 20868 / MF5171) TaxID=1116229 RepID=S3CJE0_GLAL2|nr:uncharacterized protein GLAREA_01236 [Glarea lozoyensis ATCC 20868]EPE25324.1 hypothetical protein GLAREA_01236 [Glarea lozoyensis ATCC 20868]